MAEREGFEPSVPLAEHDDLANRCLRPLGHLSKKTTTPTRQIAPYTTKPIPPPSSKICLQRLGKARDRKDATVGAKRLGLHRALCGFAADRARRPPFRALSFFGVSPVAPQGRSVAVEGLALRACTLRSLFSVLRSLFSGAAKPPLWRDSVEIPRAARPTGAMEPAGFPRQTVFAVKLPQTLLGQGVGRETVARKRKVESPSGREKRSSTVPSSVGVEGVTVGGAARGCVPSRLCGAMA